MKISPLLFASDLDRTLIYSRHFLEEEGASLLDFSCVEWYRGEPLSYLVRQAIPLLQQLAARALFVPATTRTEEQYRRIRWELFELSPPYAILCNGGKILVQGKEDLQWRAKIHQRLAAQSLSLKQVAETFQQELAGPWVHKFRQAEDLFLYAVIERQALPRPALERFARLLQKEGWTTSLQGRKLYFVPHPVNKGDALRYLLHTTKTPLTFAAGDALLDLPLLQAADHARAPRHGELYLRSPQENPQGNLNDPPWSDLSDPPWSPPSGEPFEAPRGASFEVTERPPPPTWRQSTFEAPRGESFEVTFTPRAGAAASLDLLQQALDLLSLATQTGP